MRTRAICLSLLVAVAAPSPLHAQEQKTAPATVDVGDLWRDLRHRDAAQTEAPATNEPHRFLVVAPTIGSKPTTGLTGGLNGNMAFFRGDPATTRISTLTGGFRVSQKKQVLSVSRQPPRVRRSRVPRHADEQRPARLRRLRQHDHHRQRRCGS